MENILAASSLCRAHRRWGCTARISIHSPHGLQRRVNGASQRADAHGGSSSKDAVWHSVLAMIHALSFLHSCDDRGCFITCCFPLLKLLWAAGPLNATGNDCSTPPSICEGHSEAALILTVGHDYGETSADQSSPIRHVMPPDEKPNSVKMSQQLCQRLRMCGAVPALNPDIKFEKQFHSSNNEPHHSICYNKTCLPITEQGKPSAEQTFHTHVSPTIQPLHLERDNRTHRRTRCTLQITTLSHETDAPTKSRRSHVSIA